MEKLCTSGRGDNTNIARDINFIMIKIHPFYQVRIIIIMNPKKVILIIIQQF